MANKTVKEVKAEELKEKEVIDTEFEEVGSENLEDEEIDEAETEQSWFSGILRSTADKVDAKKAAKAGKPKMSWKKKLVIAGTVVGTVGLTAFGISKAFSKSKKDEEPIPENEDVYYIPVIEVEPETETEAEPEVVETEEVVE